MSALVSLKDIKEVLIKTQHKILDIDEKCATRSKGFVPFGPVNNYDEVFPGILLGNEAFARDLGTLRRLKVTHIINCSMGKRFAQVNTNAEFYKDLNSVSFMGIEALDTANFKLSKHFVETSEYISAALIRGGRVAVHCHMGMSRSATIVLAFLVSKHDIPILEAVHNVCSKRYIYPNDGFCRQLAQLHNQHFGLHVVEKDKSENLEAIS